MKRITAAQNLLLVLQNMEHNGPIREDAGICSNVVWEIGRVGLLWNSAIGDYMGELFVRWPEASGERLYPVPGYTTSALHAYNTKRKWTRWTQYGRARRRLLKWMIEQCKKDIEQLANVRETNSEDSTSD